MINHPCSPRHEGADDSHGQSLNKHAVGQCQSSQPNRVLPRRGLPGLGELELVELLVDAVLLQQLLMRAGFANLAVVHDDDAVAVLNR